MILTHRLNTSSTIKFFGVIIGTLVFVPLVLTFPALAFGVLGLFFYAIVIIVVVRKFFQTGFDLFSPVVFFGAFFLLTYLIKSIYIIFASTYGPFVLQNYIYILNSHSMIYFGAALGLSGFCSLLFLYIINVHWYRKSTKRTLFGDRTWRIQRVSLSFFVISLILFTLFSWLIYSSGGLKFYIQSVAGRQSFFYGKYYIYVLIDLFPEIAFFFMAAHLERRKYYPKIYLLVLFGLVLVANLVVSTLAGNRSTFLIGFMIPLLVFWHYRVKAIKVSYAALTLFIVLFTSIIYITTFRGGNIVERLNVGNIQQNAETSIKNFTSSVFNGPDLVFFDLLMVTMQEFPVNHPYFAGESIKALLAFPVPRALYADKPVRGNWLFTRAVFPAWHVNFSGFAVSYAGDWYMNFGVVGTIVGMVLLAFGLKILFIKLDPKKSWVSAVFYGIVLSSTIAVLRSDIFSLINLSITLIFAVAITLFCSSKKVIHQWFTEKNK